jgi:hypothetical protein
MLKRLIGPMLAVLAMVAVMFAAIAQAQTEPTPTPQPQSAGAAPTPSPVPSMAEQAKARRDAARRLVKLRKQISQDRKSTWRWQELMQTPKVRKPYPRANASSLVVLKRLARIWHNRKVRTKHKAQHPPHKWLWLCIHRQEGSWTDNASNNPHWGGLQMGMWFMQTYAPKLLAKFGRANNWPPLMQIWVAENAFKREGYSRSWLLGQWVPTASRCI